MYKGDSLFWKMVKAVRRDKQTPEINCFKGGDPQRNKTDKMMIVFR